jgi:hypothetical protein
MTTILTYLDDYCERAGDPALFAEPLNAVTNLFFILAAVLAARAILQLPHARMRGRADLWLLVAAMFSIGVGSGIWHMHPTGATVLMDVIPITVFINIYLLSALRRLFDLRPRRVICWWLLYQLLTIAASLYLPPDLLHGTVMYLPTYAAMVGLTFGLTRTDRAVGRRFAVITTVWSASLIFRTIDMEVCTHLAIGTHFLWHTLNAWVLYQLLMLLVQKQRPVVAVA